MNLQEFFVQFLGLAVYKDPASRIRLPAGRLAKSLFSESHPILDFPRMKEAQELGSLAMGRTVTASFKCPIYEAEVQHRELIFTAPSLLKVHF